MQTQFTKPSHDRPQVLLLTQRVPFPPNRGDRIRAFHILKYLSDYSDISLGCVTNERVDDSQRRTLETYCRQIAISDLGPQSRWMRAGINLVCGRSATEGFFYDHKLARTIDKWTSNLRFDAAIVYCSSMGTYRRFFRQRPDRVLVDLVDVDSQKWVDYSNNSSGFKRLLYRCEANRVRSLERKLSRYADAISVISDEEAAVFRQCHPGLKAHAISNGVDLEYYHPDALPLQQWQRIQVASPQLVFVGVLDYLPNAQGLTWFCKSVLPLIRQEFPCVRLDIVGRRPTAQVEALGKTEGVRLVGEVDDVRPYVLASNIVIAPLQIARGLQNKVLEGLACGRPVVASNYAATGIKTRSGLFVADTPQAWLEHIRHLSNSEIHSTACTAARDGVANLYSWNAQLAPLVDLLDLTKPHFSVKNHAAVN